MALQVQTARVSFGGPERFDITRKSGGAAGRVFAPSWAILRPALDARREALRLVSQPFLPPDILGAYKRQAVDIEADAWATYVPAYLAEMRESYRLHRAAWDALLARERVVCCCYCVDAERCHRRILAGVLVKLGAVYEGEVETVTKAKRGGR